MRFDGDEHELDSRAVRLAGRYWDTRTFDGLFFAGD